MISTVSESTIKTQNDGLPIRRHQHRHNVNSRYVFIKTLGKGTYGKVKLARHKESNQLVAVKSIRKDQVKDSVDMRHIRREMELMSSIRHQHIIQIYEVFENQDKIVIVMEYASGGELYEYLASKSGITDDEARGFFRQIVSAVRYCHQQGIVHRDLKLENILLDKDNRIKIADFGLANSFKNDSVLHTFCGSPLYASPEIVCGVPYKGPEVDSWSLGVLLYALVYGTMPFDGRNYQLLTKQITSGVFTKPPRQSNAYELICWMLTVDPRQRATVNDVAMHSWVGLGPETSPELKTRIPAETNISVCHNHNSFTGKVLTTTKATPSQSLTPKSILKHNRVALLPARPHSLPATPLGDSLADQLAAVCGFNTKDSLILKSSDAATKRRMIRPKRDRKSGYYSSPEQAQFLHNKVSASEPTLTGIGETSAIRPAQVNAIRASWPNSTEHSASLPSGMSTCGLVDQHVKERFTSLSSDDGCSVGSTARPESTYSDSSALSSESFDICTFDSNVVQPAPLPHPSTLLTSKAPVSRPLTLSLTPDNLPLPQVKDLEKHAPGSLTPQSEILVRELERILAPSGRRRASQKQRGFESGPQIPNPPNLLPVIADLNDNFECKKGIDSCTNITLAEV